MDAAVNIVRAAITHSATSEAVAAGVYRNLVTRQGHAFARSMVPALVALLPESDKATASRVILTHRD
jgi:hypothetical protein